MFFLERRGVNTNQISLSILSLNLLVIFPLIFQTLPIGGVYSYLTLFFFLCLFLILNLKNFLRGFLRPSLPMLVLFLYILSFFVGICISVSETSIYIFKEFVWGCFSFLTLCCVNIYFREIHFLKRVENIFTYSAVPLFGMISLFAYLKYLIWKDGYIINFLIGNQDLAQYPKGTALVGDINFFSLTLLICSFLSFSLWRKSSTLFASILWMLFFILPIIIGFLAGSRRFALLSITLTPILFLLLPKFDANIVFKKINSVFIACFLILGIGYFINNISDLAFYFEVFTVLSSTQDTWLSYFNTFSTMADPNQYFGLDARIVRWHYGLNLLDLRTIFIGDGFKYINEFNCKFADCSGFDYPHAPILSSILYGGIFGLLTYLILITFLMFISLKLIFFSKSYFEWGLVLLSTIIFTSISGNSLLSMPVLFSATVIAYAVYKIEFGETDYEIAKRLFDIIISSLMIMLLFPFFILIGLTIFLVAGRPVFYCEPRPGVNCILFKMYKFRTMHNVADKSGNLLPDKDRLIRFGSFFRSTSLDEIPELWNVLIGEMSLVGPRPLLKEYLQLYSSYQLRRQDIRPGITGWAQINGRNSLNWDEKFNLDIWYLENMSFWLDIKILGITLIKVFKREGISSEGEVTTKPFEGNN